MNSSLLTLSFLVMVSFMVVESADNGTCYNDGNAWCGSGCKGTPKCKNHTCGNKANMCYCECADVGPRMGTYYSCKTSETGYKWNGGIKNADGSYALNGTKGDGREYDC